MTNFQPHLFLTLLLNEVTQICSYFQGKNLSYGVIMTTVKTNN